MFYFFGVGLNLFLLVLLLSKKNKSFADKVLAGWLFVIGCHLSLYVLSQQPITLRTVHLMGVSMPFPFLHGPFLYLYTAAVTQLLPRNRKLLLLHFIPAFILLVIGTPFFLLNAAAKMEVFLNKGKDYADFMFIAGWLMRVSGVIYVIWSFLLLRKHKKNIGELFSYEERINLNWLRYHIYALLAVWMIIIFVKKDSFIFSAVVVFVVLFGYFGVRQVGIFGPKAPAVHRPTDLETGSLPLSDIPAMPVPGTGYPDLPLQTEIPELSPNIITDIYEPVHAEDDTVPVEDKGIKKYSNSGLTAQAAASIHAQLTRLMQEEKIYTEAALSLSMLAARLEVHPNYLSQVINEREHKSFFDYINFLRVEEFKRLVELPENRAFTLMSLAYDCGFNSKSSFNKNFKKITGQSPSVYLAQHTGSS